MWAYIPMWARVRVLEGQVGQRPAGCACERASARREEHGRPCRLVMRVTVESAFCATSAACVPQSPFSSFSVSPRAGHHVEAAQRYLETKERYPVGSEMWAKARQRPQSTGHPDARTTSHKKYNSRN